MQLRDYQVDAVQAVLDAWPTGVTRPAVVLPTGLGKSVVAAEIARHVLLDRGGPVLMLQHRDELVRQNAAKMHAIIPGVTVGVVKAERNETDVDVIVASVQTLSRPARLAQIPRPSVVIVDECHHASADSYQRVLDACGVMDGSTPAVGFTATMTRTDKRNLADTWQQVVYSQPIRYGITHGHLADVRGLSVEVSGLDTAGLPRSRGDLQDGALADALDDSYAPESVADAYAEHAADRLGVLFAPTVDSAYSFAAALSARGIPAETLHAGTPVDERQRLFAAHERGDVQVLANVGVLTEGWDSPATSCCVIARPTQSAGLYVQMVGRVLRPFPGKVDALVLDVVGASQDHALATISALSPTPLDVQPGESLLTAVLRSDRKTEDEQRLVRDGRIDLAGVDLFHARASVWLRSGDGVWFITAGDHLLFLAPETCGTFSVGMMPSRGPARAERLATDLPLDFAMFVAEERANVDAATLASRTARWRRAQPSPAQVTLAERLGIVGADQMRKGELSDAISVTLATPRLRRFAPSALVGADR